MKKAVEVTPFMRNERARGYIHELYPDGWSLSLLSSKEEYQAVSEKALTAGITDQGYQTHNYGRVASYRGHCLIEIGQKKYYCVGVMPGGTPTHLKREGYIAIYPLNDEQAKEMKTIFEEKEWYLEI